MEIFKFVCSFLHTLPHTHTHVGKCPQSHLNRSQATQLDSSLLNVTCFAVNLHLNECSTLSMHVSTRLHLINPSSSSSYNNLASVLSIFRQTNKRRTIVARNMQNKAHMCINTACECKLRVSASAIKSCCK